MLWSRGSDCRYTAESRTTVQGSLLYNPDQGVGLQDHDVLPPAGNHASVMPGAQDAAGRAEGCTCQLRNVAASQAGTELDACRGLDAAFLGQAQQDHGDPSLDLSGLQVGDPCLGLAQP